MEGSRTGTAGTRRTKALLLAAGRGTRLRPAAPGLPKCLVPILGRPLLDYWLDALAAAGLRDVLINTHHHAAQVRAHIAAAAAARGMAIREAHEPELLGSAGTVHANRSWAEDADEVLVAYADNLSTVDLAGLLEHHHSGQMPVTMALFRTPCPSSCGIATLDGRGRVTGFVEKPEAPASDLANAGLYVVEAAAWREIADMAAFDLGFDVLGRYVGRMQGVPVEGYHRDIGTPQALAAARADAPALFGGEAARAAVFLDRDGTLVELVHHLTDPADLRLIPGAGAAVARLGAAGYPVVLVTNQSVIGRGLLDAAGLEAVHDELRSQLAGAGAALDGIQVCPLAPRGDDPTLIEDAMRKPGPGLLLRAAREHGLNPDRSWMIGDSIADMLAGRHAGCRTILVRTGYGARTAAGDPAVDHVAADLAEAAAIIEREDAS
jgi:histidinol-phosphate phosphatase family protein